MYNALITTEVMYNELITAEVMGNKFTLIMKLIRNH